MLPGILATTWLVLVAMPPATHAKLTSEGILFPRESETRELRSLDGVWNFRSSPEADPLLGFREEWYLQQLSKTGKTIPMPVPASYNDVTQDKELRDHVGLVWYDRTFFVSDTWAHDGRRVWLRFGSVSYAAQVWVNGQIVMSHEIGHLPFHRDITKVVRYGQENLITVAVDNILGENSVPQGALSELNTDEGPKVTQTYTFDFFNYAGIHRPVYLYTTPAIYIDDITVHTDVVGDTGVVEYQIWYGGENKARETPVFHVELLDRDGNKVVKNSIGAQGKLEIPLARLWWPYLMDPSPGYLYTLQVRLILGAEICDVYRLPVGIRKVEWSNTTLTINDRPLYLRGFGKHEDSDIRGKGLDYPLVVKDYNLLKWVGANSYRTSHYPYAEEIMDMADQQGIVIIDECPSVDTTGFSAILLKKHKDSLGELIRRDKNRPSVIMWSIANEPRTSKPEADAYFGSIAEYVRSIDTSRPITMATAQLPTKDYAVRHLDIIGFNRYNAWYNHAGRLDTITDNVEFEAEEWHHTYGKPIIMMEYGADTMEGLHSDPPFIWSEEFQTELLSKHFEAFDSLRTKGFFVGEMIWNFADFRTAQGYTRVGGNKKGIFTRERQPKAAAHLVRKRNFALAKIIDNWPSSGVNLYHYIASTTLKTEL